MFAKTGDVALKTQRAKSAHDSLLPNTAAAYFRPSVCSCFPADAHAASPLRLSSKQEDDPVVSLVLQLAVP